MELKKQDIHVDEYLREYAKAINQCFLHDNKTREIMKAAAEMDFLQIPATNPDGSKILNKKKRRRVIRDNKNKLISIFNEMQIKGI